MQHAADRLGEIVVVGRHRPDRHVRVRPVTERVVLPRRPLHRDGLRHRVAVQPPQLRQHRVGDLRVGPLPCRDGGRPGGEGQQRGGVVECCQVVPGVPPRPLRALLADRVDALVPEPVREAEEHLLERVHPQSRQRRGVPLRQRRLDGEVRGLQHADRHRHDRAVRRELRTGARAHRDPAR